jgi:hypothetical protein
VRRSGSPKKIFVKKTWFIIDCWKKVLKEQQPQRGLIIDSRRQGAPCCDQPVAMNAATHIFQKSVKNQKL